MPRYIIHLKNTDFKPSDAKELLRIARDLVANDAIIRDLRVAKEHIELDVSIESSMLDKLLNELKKIAPLYRYREISDNALRKEDAIKYTKILFNEERYWEAHEVLESIWRESNGYEKSTLQGIILICAAFVHMQKGEDDIAYIILNRALPKLKLDNYDSIDVKFIKSNVMKIIKNRVLEEFKI
jgi:hypothetical protein